jgi:hypothetical protein
MPADRTTLTACLHDLFRQPAARRARHRRHGRVPHASLVAFAASPDLRRLVFTTARATRKFRNLAASGTAALLIDNRANTAGRRGRGHGRDRARPGRVRCHGRGARPAAQPCSSPATRAWPTLFTRAPDTALVAVTVERYLLVDRFQRVRVLAADGPRLSGFFARSGDRALVFFVGSLRVAAQSNR